MRAQYLSGAVEGELAASYAEELGEASQTETFVAMLELITGAGLRPFLREDGKRLPENVQKLSFSLSLCRIISRCAGERDLA